MKSDFNYFNRESIRQHIGVRRPSLYSPYFNQERRYVAGHPRCPGELQYPGLKHVGSRPVCVHRECRTVRLVRTSSVSWIFKLDIKGAKSPHERALATGSRRTSRGRHEFRGGNDRSTIFLNHDVARGSLWKILASFNDLGGILARKE